MSRSTLLSLLLCGLLATGLAARNGALLALSLPLLVYLGAGLIFGPETLRLEVTRLLSADYVAPGEPLHVQVSVVNRGARLEYIELEDQIIPAVSPAAGRRGVLASLEAGQSIELEYTLRAPRGYYRLPGVRATARDRLDMFRRQVVVGPPGQIFVVPPVLKVRRVAIRPSRTRVYSGSVPARQGGTGTEFFGVREYQPGDPLRSINWRSTARAWQAIYTTEFEQERLADVGLIFDVRRRSYAPPAGDPLFEQAILAAASLAEVFLSTGNRVGLLLYGLMLDWTFPGYGKQQLRRILNTLARADFGDSQVFERFDYIPTPMFPPQSQLVVISPLLAGDVEPLIALRARGYSLLVISPDPIGVEQQHWGQRPAVALAARLAHVERALMLRRLRRAGVRALDWNVATPFEQAAHSVLGRSSLWLRAGGF